MPPLVSPDQLRHEARRQRRHLPVAWLAGVVMIAGAVAIASLDGGASAATAGVGATLVVLLALGSATIAARRAAARWDAAAATGLGPRWRGVVTGMSTNTYGVRWGVEVAGVDHPGSPLRLLFRGGRAGPGRRQLREGDPVSVELAHRSGNHGRLVGAIRNDRTGDVLLVEARPRQGQVGAPHRPAPA